jgi:sodium transport system ATP-binding protein
MIEAHGLTKVFRDRKRGEIKAVDGLSFTCHPGQIYGLLGANGAGKTTTLRMLATLLKPSAGNARLGGFDTVRQSDDVRRCMGFLATSTAIYSRLTAREVVSYFGRLNGLEHVKIKERVKALADVLEMHEFLDQRCDKLSTGMKQKVSIARTLVHDPSVIIFDEPTVGLDVLAARALIGFIRNYKGQGRTIIYSTHVMSEVEKLCDVVGIVHGGRMLAEGTLPELRAKYGETDMEEIFVKVVGGAS